MAGAARTGGHRAQLRRLLAPVAAHAPAWCAAVCLLLGVTVLVGWATESWALVAGADGLPAAPPWTGALLVLTGGALLAATRGAGRTPDAATAAGRSTRPGRGGLVLVSAVLLVSVVALVQHAVGGVGTFDTLLFGGALTALVPADPDPGRTGLTAALGFALLAGALLSPRATRATAALPTVTFGLAYLALLGYLYGEHASTGGPGLTTMSLAAALGLVAGAVAVTLLTPGTGLTALLRHPGVAGEVMRRVLLGALVLPPLAGLVLTVGDPATPWTSPTRASLLVLGTAAALVGTGAWTATRAAGAERERASALATAERSSRLAHDRAARLDTLLSVAPVGIFETDRDGVVVWVNEELTRLTGRTLTHTASSTWTEAVHPEDRARVAAAWADAVAGGGRFTGSARLVAPDGDTRVVHVVADTVRDETGAVTGLLGAVTDVTVASRAQVRFRAAFEDAPVGMVLVGGDDRVTQANRAMADMLATTPEALAGTPLAALVHPDDLDLLAERLAVPAGEPGSVPRRDLRWCTDGDPVWSSVHAVRLDDSEGHPARHLLHVLDVNERHEHEQRLAHLADHDPLTGLLNRRAFDQRLREALDRISRYGGLGTLLLFDLDDFKPVNDRLGHSSGDELLVRVAEQLEGHLRTSDLLGRLGGDEFAVYLPHADRERAATVAEKVRATVRATAVTGPDGGTHHVTASIGVAVCDPGTCDAGSLFRRADGAMYDAKYGGGDRYVVAGGDCGGRPQPQWGKRLEHALAHDRLVLYAQPIVDLRTRATLRYEVLVRLVEEDDTLVPPGAFLQEAERLGAMPAVDRWVVERAIGLAAALGTSGPSGTGQGNDLARGNGHGHAIGNGNGNGSGSGQGHGALALPSLEVNLSGRSLADPGLVARVAACLEASDVDPGRLVFEVTETDAIAHLRQVSQAAAGLQSLGCRFALDDVGAGFGSFAYLKHLPVDVLKIDGELVRGAVGNAADRLVVEALVAVAHGLGKETVAEHVVDPVVYDRMRELGVDLAQGYGVGRPVPASGLLPRSA